MRYFSVLSLLFFYVNVLRRADSSLSFNYERALRVDSGRRHNIPAFAKILYKRDAFPEPLPPKPIPKEPPVPTPYNNLYQGRRRPRDKRVYRERFYLVGQSAGQQVSFEGTFDCPITYLAVETQCNVPIVLRGGCGYTYFNVIIKAKPYDEMSGQVRAYCLETEEDYYREKNTPNAAKLYIFQHTSEMPALED